MKYLLLHIGQYFIMIKKVFSFPEKKRIFLKQFNLELEKTGLNSLGIVTIISFFIGAVVSIQTAYNFDSPLYPKYLIGYATRESLILEFCPTMLALILAGKVGSNIASEIGFKQISCSHVISPTIKFVNRGDTTVLDAYLSPIIYNFCWKS